MTAPTPTTDEIARREDLVGGYLSAWNDHDPAAIASFFAPDGVYADPTTDSEARGPAAIAEFVGRTLTAFPDLRFEFVRSAHGADFSLAEWTCTARHLGPLHGLAPTGRLVSNSGIDIATIDADDRIVRLVSYYDKVKVVYDLGLLPAPGSNVERAALVGLRGLGRVHRLVRRARSTA